MELDVTYLQKLETAARAPDHVFPEMLFEPLANDYDDIYFKLDIDDYGQEAVQVDPPIHQEKHHENQRIYQKSGSVSRVGFSLG